MFKKTLKYSFLTLAIFFLTLVYLIYFGQNRISLILNLGTNVPSDVEQISIQGRRTLRLFYSYHSGSWVDETLSAKCKTSKASLMKWLKTSNFEVIYCGKDSLGNTKLYRDFNSLPKDILDNNIGYGIQLSREIADSPQLTITPADSGNVFLQYVFDWN